MGIMNSLGIPWGDWDLWLGICSSDSQKERASMGQPTAVASVNGLGNLETFETPYFDGQISPYVDGQIPLKYI